MPGDGSLQQDNNSVGYYPLAAALVVKGPSRYHTRPSNLIIQPAATPDDKKAALDAAWDALGLPSGANFFLQFRQFIAEHEDTFVRGPTTAADYLATRAQ